MCMEVVRSWRDHRPDKCPLLGVDWTCAARPAMSAFDAVDGAHSAASECHRVVALKRTTLRGAVHGRGYHDWSRYLRSRYSRYTASMALARW